MDHTFGSSDIDIKSLLERYVGKKTIAQPDFEDLKERISPHRHSTFSLKIFTAAALIGLLSVACVTVGFTVLRNVWIADRIADGKIIKSLVPVEKVPLGGVSLSIYLKPEQHHLAQKLGIDLNVPASIGDYSAQPQWGFGVTVQSRLTQKEAEEAGVFVLMQRSIADDKALAKLTQELNAIRFLSVSYVGKSGNQIRVDIMPSPSYLDPYISTLTGEEAMVGDGKATWYDEVMASYPGNDGTATTEDLKPVAKRVQQLWLRTKNSTLVFSPSNTQDKSKQQTVDFAAEYVGTK